jgi:23S rRNA pseudouridine1911/1915/1917 synthase
MTRAQAKRLLDLDRVTVDGERPKGGTRIRGGESIRVLPPPRDEPDLRPEPIPVTVLHVDDQVVVVDKPPDLVVHPAHGHASGTLVNALAHLGAAGGDPERPGIVHRLDRGTSGVMVVARTVQAHARLAAQFHDRTVEKCYLAIAGGTPPDRGWFRDPIGRHPVDRKRFRSGGTGAREASTEYAVAERAGEWARVEIRLHTGRTHQIRVHFADHGHPLLGDPVYGRSPRDERTRAIARALGRPALHARLLAFDHPGTGRRVSFEAPIPADILAAWEAIRGG